MGRSKISYEEQALLILRSAGLPEPEREYRFHPVRRWRFDLAWPDKKVAVEIEGGGWIYGRHHRPIGFKKDLEKYNAAVLEGWKVLRYTPDMFDRMVEEARKALEMEDHFGEGGR